MEFLEIGHDVSNRVKEFDSTSTDFSSTQTLTQRIQQVEKEMILHCLEKNKWHKTKAARDLGIDRRSLFRKIKTLGLLFDFLRHNSPFLLDACCNPTLATTIVVERDIFARCRLIQQPNTIP